MKQTRNPRTRKVAANSTIAPAGAVPAKVEERGPTITLEPGEYSKKDLQAILSMMPDTGPEESEEDTINDLLEADRLNHPEDYPGTVFTYEEVMAIQRRLESVITNATLAEVMGFYIKEDPCGDGVLILAEVIGKLRSEF